MIPPALTRSRTALQAESQIFATSGSDRSVALYDLRSSTPIRKIVMQTACNSIAWNPMEPLNFVAANEDCNLYSYDMRKLTGATCVHEVRGPLRLPCLTHTRCLHALPRADLRARRAGLHVGGDGR